MLPTLKNNAAAGYKGPAKIELLKGAGLLVIKVQGFLSPHPNPSPRLLSTFCSRSRAGNNGRSTDNVRPDWGFDRSNVGLAGQVDRSHSIILK